MNKFTISFNAARLDENSKKHFELMLTNHKLLSGWSSPFPGMYFVNSIHESAEEISDSIEDFFDKRGLFVARVYEGQANRNGRLASAIWEFLKADQ